MAIIKCPECGKEISDKAKSCIHCGYPIEDINTAGIIKVKVSALKAPTGFSGNQKVSIFAGCATLWEGQVGEVAELHIETATEITVKYHMSLMHYGGECSGVIDPAKSKKYNVAARQGIMSTKLVLQPVDVFDAD